MAFSKDQVKLIEREVGGMCERRVPFYFREKIRLIYEIVGQNVYIRESRPDFRDPTEWNEMDVAKLRYIAASKEWRLYWMRASGKWWRYELPVRSKSLLGMVKEIDADHYGCFFG